MNKDLKNALVALTFLLSLTGIASAVDFQVSCTIPAIPGLNVPLIEEETRIPPEENFKTQESETAFAKSNIPQKGQQAQSAPSLIQQESQLTTSAAQPLIVVRTLYDR